MFGRIRNKSKSGRNNSEEIVQTGSYGPIPPSADAVKASLNEIFSNCCDFILREIACGKNGAIRILVAYIDGFVSKNELNQDVVRPILDFLANEESPGGSSIYNRLTDCIVVNNDIHEAADMHQAVDGIISGEAVLFIDGETRALVVGVKAPQGRQVQEPDTETSIRGAREGFVENLLTNTALIRKRIKNPNLKLEMMHLGDRTKTNVCICYIKGLANEAIVREVRERLKKIKTDAVLDSGIIEQYISDNRLSLFPTVGSSEKCDKLAGKLLEGRVAIFCDGSPHVLTVPYLFVESIQATDDYFDHAFFATFMRLLRVIALTTSTLLPAMYVALVVYHHTVIPFKLLLTLAASQQGIPFSPFVEAMLMIVAFELLREAGVRMPKPIGQALSIVGAIVLGEASVAAGIASNLMVIVVAITAVCSFIVPPLIRVTMILRFVYLAAANTMGILGIAFVAVAVFVHLCKLRSFGVPYMAPFAPLTVSDLKDSFIVVPIWAMVTRPKVLRQQGNKRGQKGTKRQEVYTQSWQQEKAGK
ncbi:MAG TPA: spore germination protein [Thermoclostridium caenicola]|uniref:spore germination protein n=1 Tax=Thermoclostridium caenicola TaxID=659425 RepID=UPI002CF6EF70|nr:spore germination protein [Thermoclostridium caenicola]HOK43466.1 spore germination protein [Thermoclostridium caenicola]HPO77737.1 spore germination protein [Thermoclostridium caenicola]